MKIYHCKRPYLSGLLDEPAPCWPQDYEAAEDMDQAGTGKEALWKRPLGNAMPRAGI
jgi:hypothetical protein